MKVHVVYDQKGKVLGGAVSLPEPDGPGPRSGPVAGDGQHTAILDVPAAHAELALHELAERIRVDVTGKEHKLVQK